MRARERFFDLLRRAQGVVRLERGLSRLGGELQSGVAASDARNDVRATALDVRIATVEAQGVGVEARLAGIEAKVAAVHDLLSSDVRNILRAVMSEDAENRRRLWDARAREDYEAAFQDPEPLVSILIPTFDRPELLAMRSLPSVLGQSYERIEVVIVGDAAGPEVEQAALSLGDDRVRFHNLTQRLPLSSDPQRRWFAQSVMARNEASRLARGDWLAWFDDDDEMQPHSIRLLLHTARENRVEVAYGRFRMITANGSEDVGVFPPETGRFGWQTAIWHRSLRFFERELFSAYFETPSDGFLVEAMLRAGVRFAMIPDVVCNYYPSQLR